MARYFFALDETGSFMVNGDQRSFVCGVHVTTNESTLKSAYQKTYTDFGFPQPVPSRTDELLKTNDCIDDNARFHFNRLNNQQKEFCKENLLPHVGQVFISAGKPTLYANNQNWWLIAIVVVIREFLKRTAFEANPEIEVLIDNRGNNVWGVIAGEQLEFKEYHNILRNQILENVRQYKPKGAKLNISFKSDTSSLFINLADIVCGFVRKERAILADRITECACQSYVDNTDPVPLIETNPIMAFSGILQQIAANNLNNMGRIAEILDRLRADKEGYSMAWDMFYDLLKFKISEREGGSCLLRIKPVVEAFKNQLFRQGLNKPLEMMTLIMEYYSHIGDIEQPFLRKDFIGQLKESASETRILRKWEKLLSYSLREAQFLFNGYRFAETIETFEDLWGKQEMMIGHLPADLFAEEEKRDEPTTAILGTLAQAYAYKGDLDEAIEHFKLSKDYAIRTTSRTDSYLFAVYHRKKDVEACRSAFQGQVGMTAEEYMKKGDFGNQWALLSYCKLCALELYLNKNTELPIPIDYVLGCKEKEYPFPLIQKWAGVALFLQGGNSNSVEVGKLFYKAIEELLNTENGFAVKTLALPIIQCYALVNNQNPFHAQYGTILRDLMSMSQAFAECVERKYSILSSIKGDADIWQRAMVLPFIYS